MRGTHDAPSNSGDQPQVLQCHVRRRLVDRHIGPEQDPIPDEDCRQGRQHFDKKRPSDHRRQTDNYQKERDQHIHDRDAKQIAEFSLYLKLIHRLDRRSILVIRLRYVWQRLLFFNHGEIDPKRASFTFILPEAKKRNRRPPCDALRTPVEPWRGANYFFSSSKSTVFGPSSTVSVNLLFLLYFTGIGSLNAGPL